MKQAAVRSVLIGITVSLLCLWLAFRQVPFADLANSLQSARLSGLAVAFLGMMLSLVARAHRWSILLNGCTSTGPAFWALSIGNLLNNILPLRAGEAARIVVLSGSSRIPLVQVAGSVIIERMLDAFMLLLLLLLVFPWMQVPIWITRTGMALSAVTLVLFLMLLASVAAHARVESWLEALRRRIPLISSHTLSTRWRELVQGLSPFFQKPTALSAFFWSFVIWGGAAFMYWAVLRAFQPDATWIEAGFILAALSLAIAVPSSPGFVGVFQYAGQQALVLPFGDKYDPALALAITLAAHLMSYIITSFWGVLGFWQSRTSFTHVLEKIRRKNRDLSLESGEKK